jgi:Polyketide cyclase / dehydrase and lipid transport
VLGSFFVCPSDLVQVKRGTPVQFREENMAKKIAIGVAALIVVLLLVIATRPDTYHVERTKTIAASPEVIYGHVADFHKWKGWSPWDKVDPNMKRTFVGTDGAVGASYAWVGNDDVGEGKMTLTAVEPAKRVEIKLEFIKPFESVASNGFKFEAAGKDTKVTWYMDGNNNFLGKAMCMFMNMDQMIGKDFEKGLDAMKQIAESTPAPAAAAN